MDTLIAKRNDLLVELKVVKKQIRRPAYNEYHKNYQNDKYQNDPDFAEQKRKKILERYHSTISDEVKEKRNAYAREYYQRKKEQKV